MTKMGYGLLGALCQGVKGVPKESLGFIQEFLSLSLGYSPSFQIKSPLPDISILKGPLCVQWSKKTMGCPAAEDTPATHRF